jgi:phospholipid/cholesterol/gamma-HCH transport system permease protein
MRQVGTTGYVAVMPTWGGLRLAVPEMVGWILAAKVGCGLVAEIGSARISDEIDALEVMGVDSRVYLVATRVLASIIVMPFIYAIGLFLYYLGAYFGAVILYGAVSSGGFLTVLWITQNAADIFYSFLIALVCWLVVILIGCYYGFYSSGGPVGVGRNTAKSMMVNIIWVSVIGMILGQAVWGFAPNAPISN